MKNNFTIIPTLHAEHLARRFTPEEGISVVYIEPNKEGKRFFPDSEVYVRLPEINVEERIVVLHTGAPDPNGGIIELEMVLSALIDLKCPNIEVFFTYFPYGMQDNPKHFGETNAAENLIRKLVNYYGVKRIYVLDGHFWGQAWLSKYPVENISALPLLKEAALKDYSSAIFLAPDEGSQRRMMLHGTKKNRKNSFEIEIVHDDNFISIIKDQIVGVADDLVETGGTSAKFAELCLKNGANDVIALITHGLLEKGVSRLKEAYSKVYFTNSIEDRDANIDVSDLIFQKIKKGATESSEIS